MRPLSEAQPPTAASAEVLPPAPPRPAEVLGCLERRSGWTAAPLTCHRDLVARITETSPLGIAVVNRAGEIVFANPRAEQTLGLSMDRLVQRSYNAPAWKITGVDGEPFADEQLPFRRVLDSEQPVWDVRHALERSDGRRIVLSVSAAPLRNDAGELDAVVCMIEDITARLAAEDERRRAVEDLRTSEERLTLALSSSQGAVWDLQFADAAADEWVPDKMYLSPSLKQMIGYGADFPDSAAAWKSRIVPEDLPDFDRSALDHLAGRTEWHDVEYRIRHKDQTIRWFHRRGRILRDERGRLLRWTGIDSDITQRKQLEQRMEAAQTQAAHLGRLTTMAEMATSLAHELNQPLAAITMRAEVAAEEMCLGLEIDRARLCEVLTFVANEAFRAGEIIRRLRAFVKKNASQRQRIGVHKIVQEIMPLINHDLLHCGIELTVDVRPELPRVDADRIQVQQVLLNLIRNAAEALRTSDVGQRRLSICAHADAGMLEVRVCDTGVGMDDQQLASLFEAFSTSKPDGMGIGLAISRTIIEAHGGRIWAARNPERGMTFMFTLPIASEENEHGT